MKAKSGRWWIASLVDVSADAQAWGATAETSPHRFNVTFSKIAGETAGFDGTDPRTGAYAISYVGLGIAVS